MARHKRKPLRNWLQLIPAGALAACAFLGVHSVEHYTLRASEAVSTPSTAMVSASVPEKHAEPLIVPLSPIQQAPQSYVVVKNNSLWSIAKAHCGSGNLWTKLATANKLQSYTLFAGQILSLQC